MKCFMLICILGHILFISNSEALKYECPEPVDIYPCYCEEENGDPWVYCNHLTQPDQLYDGIKNLKDYKIYRLAFFKNWILDPIKSNAFEGLTVERLVFENSTITLSSPHFQGLSGLYSLQLRGMFNKTNPIIPLDLSQHEGLREILFEKNRVITLPNDWLKSSPDSLRSVTVEGNTIVTLEDEVFAKIKRLTFLALEDNRIVIIKRSMFPRPAQDLRTLDLNNNRIRYLPSDIFSDMPSLRMLEMVGNRLTTLDKDVWSDVLSIIIKLDAEENPFECDSDLKWMYTGNQKLPPLLLGTCEKPERLQNRRLSQLKLSDLSGDD